MRPRLVYIAGKGRSGSTVLDQVLGSTPNALSVGELVQVSNFGSQPGFLCGCGDEIQHCEVWRPVLDRGIELAGNLPAMTAAIQRSLSWSRSWRFTASSLPAEAAMVSRFFDDAIQIAAEVKEVSTVIDSSMWPLAPGPCGWMAAETVVVHLVRDPRAVGHSWQRTKTRTDRPDASMPRQSPAFSSASWMARHVAAEVAARRSSPPWTTLRYEDFCAAPRDSVLPLAKWAGLIGTDEVFTGQASVMLSDHHMIGGNPDRSRTGLVEIRDDGEWNDKMPREPRRAAITAMTAPLLVRHGYPISARS